MDLGYAISFLENGLRHAEGTLDLQSDMVDVGLATPDDVAEWQGKVDSLRDAVTVLTRAQGQA